MRLELEYDINSGRKIIDLKREFSRSIIGDLYSLARNKTNIYMMKMMTTFGVLSWLHNL